jgi:hypothetical protein
MRAGFPDAARRLRTDRLRLATRALEVAVDSDPTMRERYDELGLRRLLNDAEVLLDAVGISLASNDPTHLEHWAEISVPPYRRRHIPMDDLVTLAGGIGRALESTLSPDEKAVADASLDLGIRVWKRARRLGGDARRRNRILAAIYKGG